MNELPEPPYSGWPVTKFGDIPIPVLEEAESETGKVLVMAGSSMNEIWFTCLAELAETGVKFHDYYISFAPDSHLGQWYASQQEPEWPVSDKWQTRSGCDVIIVTEDGPDKLHPILGYLARYTDEPGEHATLIGLRTWSSDGRHIARDLDLVPKGPKTLYRDPKTGEVSDTEDESHSVAYYKA